MLSVSIGSALAVIIPIADMLIVALGILLLLDINPFKNLPQIRVPGLSHPFANAFVYGLLYGPLALPCSGPLVVGIFAFSLTTGEAIGKLSVFFWFGSGLASPCWRSPCFLARSNDKSRGCSPFIRARLIWWVVCFWWGSRSTTCGSTVRCCSPSLAKPSRARGTAPSRAPAPRQSALPARPSAP